MKNRTFIIQSIINAIGAKDYLEIGLFRGNNFNRIKCKNKVGVDPSVKFKSEEKIFELTSDDFFKQNDSKFDVIFIDGLHEETQVYKDIKNGLDCLNDGCFIICHDMHPTDENMQKVPRIQNVWTGDCWKAWVNIRREMDNLSMFVVDMDYGCGVITKGKQDLLPSDVELTYANFEKHKHEWMNFVNLEGFKKFTKGLKKKII